MFYPNLSLQTSLTAAFVTQQSKTNGTKTNKMSGKSSHLIPALNFVFFTFLYSMPMPTQNDNLIYQI